jgi:small GTP-binding protein
MERYRSINSVFYREAVGAILVFDLTCLQSFKEVDSWLNEFITNAQPNPAVVLCGNKCDIGDEWEVEPHEIKNFTDANDLTFFQTSAYTGEGVREMLNGLLRLIPATNPSTSTGVQLGAEKVQAKKECEC